MKFRETYYKEMQGKKFNIIQDSGEGMGRKGT